MKSRNMGSAETPSRLRLDTNGLYGEDLLRAIRRRPISQEIRTLYQIGAHKFEEKALLHRIFSKLQKSVLFEPNPDLYIPLKQNQSTDPTVAVLPYAIADQDGETTFHVASNEGLSSSLLEFGTHEKTFPGVTFEKEIPVQVRKLSTAIKDHALPAPDFLFIDTQGAEYQVLQGISSEILQNVKLIYVEASLEELYKGARLLDDLKDLLQKQFWFMGYTPQEPRVPNHGNAMFVNKLCATEAAPNFLNYALKRLL